MHYNIGLYIPLWCDVDASFTPLFAWHNFVSSQSVNDLMTSGNIVFNLGLISRGLFPAANDNICFTNSVAGCSSGNQYLLKYSSTKFRSWFWFCFIPPVKQSRCPWSFVSCEVSKICCIFNVYKLYIIIEYLHVCCGTFLPSRFIQIKATSRPKL